MASIVFTESPTFVNLTEYNDFCNDHLKLRWDDTINEILDPRSSWLSLANYGDINHGFTSIDLSQYNDPLHNVRSSEFIDTKHIFVNFPNARTPESLALTAFIKIYADRYMSFQIRNISDLLYFRIPNTYIYYFVNLDRVIGFEMPGHGGAPRRIINSLPTIYYSCKCFGTTAAQTFKQLIGAVNGNSTYLIDSDVFCTLFQDDTFN